MTISIKTLNDNIKKISDSNSLLDMLLEFERVLDTLDMYAYKNWEKGEVLGGPYLERHYLTVTLMYNQNEMPDPAGARRLISRKCLVEYEKSILRTPKRVRTLDDVTQVQRPDGSHKLRAKTKTEPIWLVHIKMPRRFVDEFNPDILEKEEEDKYTDVPINDDVTPEPELPPSPAVSDQGSFVGSNDGGPRI